MCRHSLNHVAPALYYLAFYFRQYISHSVTLFIMSLAWLPLSCSKSHFAYLLLLLLNYFDISADPVAFRHHIGGVKSRLMELRSPVRTPEIDYDFYYQDEYYSPCKSTEKKPMQSVPNSHIFFASPNPITSPIKMSPLCENGEDGDDDVALAVKTTAIPLLLASLPASPVKVLEAVEIMDIAVESSVTPGVIEVAVETESEGVAVCSTTPSRACFTAAFSVIKSAKKSPYLNKATPAKTPCDAAVVDKMDVVHSEAMEVVQAPETDSVIVEDETSSVPEVRAVRTN